MELTKIEDYIEVLSGYAFNSKLFNSNGNGLPLIRIRDVGKNESETFFPGDYDRKFLITKGDYLIGMDGDFRIAEWKGKKALLNQRVCKISTRDSHKLDDRYLYYLLPKKLKEIEDATSFATVKHLSVKKINKIRIPIPSLKEQQKIAAILDEADRLRRLNKELIATYEQLGQSLFLEMFGDPVRNPKGWELKKFGEVGKLDRGKSKHRPRNAPKLLGGPYPLIQTGDVANSRGYITKYTSTYSELGLAQSRMWPAGTLCITIAANIAKTGILSFDACFPDSVVGFIPNEKTCNEYVQGWMFFLQKIIEEKAPAVAQKNINLSILRDLEFMTPPIEVQIHFAKSIEEIEKQKLQAQKTLEHSEALFKSLLQTAFKGELV